MKKKDILELSVTIILVFVLLIAVLRAIKIAQRAKEQDKKAPAIATGKKSVSAEALLPQKKTTAVAPKEKATPRKASPPRKKTAVADSKKKSVVTAKASRPDKAAAGASVKKPTPAAKSSRVTAAVEALPKPKLREKSLFRKLQEEVKDLSLKRDPFSSGVITAVEGPSSAYLSLSGILWDEASPKAIINGKIIEIGDRIFGYVVIRIEADRVILNDGITNFELELD